MSNIVEFDVSALTKFAKRLNHYEDFEESISIATQKIAKVLHDEVVRRSPVDTGRLRKAWDAGDNLKFTVERVKDGFMVTLINKAENKGFKYPWYVNYVYGYFFVENSVLATEQVAKQIIRKELTKWFKRCLSGK
jgi:hypothetical protein